MLTRKEELEQEAFEAGVRVEHISFQSDRIKGLYCDGSIAICDDIVYINPDNGYKIAEFFENSRICDAENQDDLKQCMKKLRVFHQQNLQVSHEFDIFKQIDFYESLWEGKPSIYRDYKKTKEHVLKFRNYIINLIFFSSINQLLGTFAWNSHDITLASTRK